MRLPGDHRPAEQCPLPKLPQEDGDYQKGEEETFVCACGYKENSPLSRSEEKKRRRSFQKDVQNYLKKQKEEPINNAFANALANIKIDT